MIEQPQNLLHIRTPEGVAFSIPLAGPIARFLAWAIDFGVTIGITLVLQMAASLFAILSPGMVQALLLVAFFVISVGYAMLFEWFWSGRTLGKFLLGLRVIDVEGLRLGFSQIALRNLVRFLDAVPLFYLVGGLTMLCNRKAQRLGDLAANTVVIREVAPKQPDLSQILPDKYNSLRSYPHIEARLRQRVSPEEASLLVQALLRRDELEPDARVHLYQDMAKHFRAKVDFPEEAMVGLSDEQYLRNLLESITRRPESQRDQRATEGAA